MLARFTQIDYDREMAFIAVVQVKGVDREIAVARYMTNTDRQGCEFAIVVADEWQHRGIARRLMERLIECAREYGLQYMEGTVMAKNPDMLALADALNFTRRPQEDDPSLVTVVKTL